MRYQRVNWHHDSPDFPVVLYSEVNDEGWEVRKVDEYANGRLDLASDAVETGNTFLGLDRVPALDEINADPQFEAVAISAAEFEAVWVQAKDWYELS